MLAVSILYDKNEDIFLVKVKGVNYPLMELGGRSCYKNEVKDCLTFLSPKEEVKFRDIKEKFKNINWK